MGKHHHALKEKNEKNGKHHAEYHEQELDKKGKKAAIKDRVRRHTAERVNDKIDRHVRDNIAEYLDKSPEEIEKRLYELEKEWDIERILETNASALAFSGLMLGMFVNKRWFGLSAAVLPFLFLHGTQGWCPPVPALRRLGVRTQQEIDAEKYALKALRGDFRHVDDGDDPKRKIRKALKAVWNI